MPRVSVVILTYNAAAYLGDAIRGALNQTLSDIELIVVDDCSTDDTQEVLRRFGDPRLRVFRNQKNLGFAGNVNRAMELVTGEFVAIPGADDVLEPTFLERTVGMISAAPKLSFVHTAATWMDATGHPYGRSNDGWRTITPGREAFIDCLRVGFCYPAVLARTSAMRAIGPLPQWWAGLADSWVVLQLCLKGDAGYIDEPLVRYRVHDASISLTMYHSGEYFRHHRDIIASAFDWPEAKAVGLHHQKTLGLRFVASDSIKLLHVNRAAMGRWTFLKQYFGIIAGSPTVLIFPHVWARLGLGLLPRNAIASLREWKRRRWRKKQDDAETTPDSRGLQPAGLVTSQERPAG